MDNNSNNNIIKTNILSSLSFNIDKEDNKKLIKDSIHNSINTNNLYFTEKIINSAKLNEYIIKMLSLFNLTNHILDEFTNNNDKCEYIIKNNG